MDAEVLIEECRQAWRPPPRLTLSQWADRYARLSPESSADEGRWKTIPYQRGIMDAITDRHIESVTVMKSARVGWTKIINHTVGYYAHYDPCPTMIVQPTIGDAEGYSKDEIAPMIRDTDVLAAIFPPPGKRDSGNTVLHKPYPGGSVRLVGADSPRGFRRVSVRILAFDEVDGYAPTAGEEGDQIKLGRVRTEYFWNRKILAGSTPTLDSTSRIKRLFEKGDMRYYRVPCPHCHQTQVLEWANLKWPKGQPELAHFVCVHCAADIEYRHHRWMLEEAERRQLAGDPTAGWVATNPDADPGHASFHIWAAYSYSPNATWAKLAAEWLDSHKNVEERKTFINTVLGLPYKGEGDAPDWKRLYDRRESYPTSIVPAGGVELHVGVDVQKDRIEAEIVAYGRNMESWSVDYRVFPGDTSSLTGASSPYRGLEALLAEEFQHAMGGKLRVRMLAIDSGFNTNTVYQWVASQGPGRTIATDGRDSYQMIVGQPTAVEITVHGRKRKGKTMKLWPVGVSLAKSELYGWLKAERPTRESGEPHPFGYCHLPEYGEEYFKQLTAEEIVPRLVRGFRRYQWEKVYNRNEVLDCRVLARAAAYLCGVDRRDEAAWARLEKDQGIGVVGELPERQKFRPKVTRQDDPYL